MVLLKKLVSVSRDAGWSTAQDTCNNHGLTDVRISRQSYLCLCSSGCTVLTTEIETFSQCTVVLVAALTLMQGIVV